MMGSDGREVYWATTIEQDGQLATQVTDDPIPAAIITMAARDAAADLDMMGAKITSWCHHGHGPDEPCPEAPQDITVTLAHCGNRCAYYDLLEVERRHLTG